MKTKHTSLKSLIGKGGLSDVVQKWEQIDDFLVEIPHREGGAFRLVTRNPSSYPTIMLKSLIGKGGLSDLGHIAWSGYQVTC